MRKLFGISVAMILVTVLSAYSYAMAEEPVPPAEAATARDFCADFLAGRDEKAATRMDQALRDALGEHGAQQVRDTLSSTLGAVVDIGEAWFVDEIQGYRRYRVPVRFEKGTRDLLIAFTPGGKIGGLFTREHLERQPASQPVGELDKRAAGDWGGTLSIPGNPLEISVTLNAGKHGWSGSIDILAQGLVGHPLEAIRVSEDEVSFRLAAIPGEPTFRGKLEGDALSGVMTQSAAMIPFALERGVKAELSRPQTPQPPFDYAAEEVSYDNGPIRLTGTLTLPPGEGPFPAVVLISGSGPQDRDEQILGHRPFLVWADHLTRAGIAVLRVDDRGVGGSGGSVSASTTSDFAEDVLAGVRFLATRPEIDVKKIGLIGHSEGGLVAPLAASRSQDVAFIVLLAGTGVPGSEVMELQMQLQLRAAGVGEEYVKAAARESRELYRSIREGETHAEIAKRLGSLKQAQGDPTAPTPAELGEITSAWMRFFLEYDPRPALRKVSVPVLALNGELDLQVDATQNLVAIRQALEHNPDVTVRRLPEMNHLFQTAETGVFGEYAQIEETVAPTVLDLVRDWILARTQPTVEHRDPRRESPPVE